MPWMAVEKAYEFEGPRGKASRLTCSRDAGANLSRLSSSPGRSGWPEHAPGPLLGRDQVAHLSHLKRRDTTLAQPLRARHRSRADGLDDALVHHDRQLRQRLRSKTNGTAIMCSSATTMGRRSARISSTTATRRWGPPGTPRSHAPRPSGGMGGFAVVVVPVPPLVGRRLGVTLRRILPCLLTAEGREIEVAPGGPHRLVAAVVDEIRAEHLALVVADEHIMAVPFVHSEVAVEAVCHGVPGHRPAHPRLHASDVFLWRARGVRERSVAGV